MERDDEGHAEPLRDDAGELTGRERVHAMGVDDVGREGAIGIQERLERVDTAADGVTRAPPHSHPREIRQRPAGRGGFESRVSRREGKGLLVGQPRGGAGQPGACGVDRW